MKERARERKKTRMQQDGGKKRERRRTRKRKSKREKEMRNTNEKHKRETQTRNTNRKKEREREIKRRGSLYNVLYGLAAESGKERTQLSPLLDVGALGAVVANDRTAEPAVMSRPGRLKQRALDIIARQGSPQQGLMRTGDEEAPPCLGCRRQCIWQSVQL